MAKYILPKPFMKLYFTLHNNSYKKGPQRNINHAHRSEAIHGIISPPRRTESSRYYFFSSKKLFYFAPQHGIIEGINRITENARAKKQGKPLLSSPIPVLPIVMNLCLSGAPLVTFAFTTSLVLLVTFLLHPKSYISFFKNIWCAYIYRYNIILLEIPCNANNIGRGENNNTKNTNKCQTFSHLPGNIQLP